MQRKASWILMLLTSLMLGVTCTFGKTANPLNDPNLNNANEVIDMLESFEAGVDAEAEARAAAEVRAAAAKTHPYTQAILTFDFSKANNLDGTTIGLSGGRCSQPQFPEEAKGYLTVAADGTLHGTCTDERGEGNHFEAVLSGALDQKTGQINFHFAETWTLKETQGPGRWTVHTEIDFHGSEKDVVWVGDAVSGLATFTHTCDSNPERPQFPCTNVAPSYKSSGVVPFTLKFSTLNPEARPHFTHAVLLLDVPNARVEAGRKPPIGSGCWPPQYPDSGHIEGYFRIDPDNSMKGECSSDPSLQIATLDSDGELNGHVSTVDGHVDFGLNVTIDVAPRDGQRMKIHYTISFNGNNDKYEWNENDLTGTATFRWDCARLEGEQLYCDKSAEGVELSADQGRGTVPFVLKFYP